MVESTCIFRHDVFSTNLQSEYYVLRFLQLSSGLDGPSMFGRAISGNLYRSQERKAMLRYRPLSRARSIDSLFILFNNTCGIRHCTLNNTISVAPALDRQLNNYCHCANVLKSIRDEL